MVIPKTSPTGGHRGGRPKDVLCVSGLVLVLLLAPVLVSGQQGTQAATSPSPTTSAPTESTIRIKQAEFPGEHRDSNAVWTGQFAYVFGGWNSSAHLDHIWRYDPTQDQLTLLTAKLPNGQASASAVWDDRDLPGQGCPKGCAYLFGGDSFDNGDLDRILRFNPETQTVTTMNARLPSARNGMSVVWTFQHAFLFGGSNDTTQFRNILRYDPLTDTLQTMPTNLPTVRYSTSAVWDSSSNTAYIFGGVGEPFKPDPTQILAYNTQSDTLETRPSTLPTPRWATVALWSLGHAFVIGGFSGDCSCDQIVRYTPASESISILNPGLPAASAGMSAINMVSFAFLFGAAVTDGGTARHILDFNIEAASRSSATTSGSPTPPPTTIATTATGTGTTPATPPILTTSSPATPGGPPGGVVPWAIVALLATTTGAFVVRGMVQRARGAKKGPATVGRAFSAATTGPANSLTFHDVRVVLGKKVIVDGASFEVAPATLTVLLGPSGSGKSTLLKAAVGLTPHSGEIRYAGVDARTNPSTAKKLLGYVPQDLQLYESLSALENVTYFASQFGVPQAAAENRGRTLLTDLGMGGREYDALSRLSGGQRRRISIAAALIHEPRFLLLDEPSAGLDFSSRKALWDLLLRLARNRGVAILATTHFIDEAHYADRVGIVHNGRVVAMASPRELLQGIPGAGRCVEVEFDRLEDRERQRLSKLLPLLQREAWVERVEYRMFTVRYFAKDPPAASRALASLLGREGFPVRATRLADVTLEDVFSFHTGENFAVAEP